MSEPADQAAVIQRIKGAALALLLHQEAQQPLAGVELPRSGDVLLIVGPEGGVTDEELSAFVAAGASRLSLLGSGVTELIQRRTGGNRGAQCRRSLALTLPARKKKLSAT